MLPLKIIFIVFGVILVLWGSFRLTRDKGLIGDKKGIKHVENFIIMGEASGLGQLLSGILVIIVGIVLLFIE